ncbi:MAG: hypothetical protein AAGM22_00920 [Acidobacteriota bacterium]
MPEKSRSARRQSMALSAGLVAALLAFAGSPAWGQGPFLRAEKNVGLAIDADGDSRPSPGDTLAYSLRVQNAGDADANDVVLTDPIPFAATLVDGSIFISQGDLLDVDPIVVAIGTIEGDLDSVSVGFRVRIDDPVPAGTSGIINQGTVTSAELEPIVTDDPATTEPGDATVVTLPGTPPSVIDVPALGRAGLAVLAALMVLAAGAALRRRGAA